MEMGPIGKRVNIGIGVLGGGLWGEASNGGKNEKKKKQKIDIKNGEG